MIATILGIGMSVMFSFLGICGVKYLIVELVEIYRSSKEEEGS